MSASDRTIVIDPTPNRLWGTYYGGEQTDYISEADTDFFGNLYITGNTFSRYNFATTGAFIIDHYSTDPYGFSPDGYISKLDTNGYKIWATYLRAKANDIDVDSDNNIISTGYAVQFDVIGTPGTHKPTKLLNDFDGYILKLNPNGQRIWGTYYGGNSFGEDIIWSAAIDNSNNILITGHAYSQTNISTPGAHKPTKNSGYKDAFIAKITPNGQRIWGTYYGGTWDEEALSIIIDENNNTYITGNTKSSDGIAFGNSHQSTINNTYSTGFIAGFNNSGNIIFGTYLGGTSYNYFNKIDYNNQKILVSGKTTSSDISTTSNAPYQNPTSNILSNFNGFFALFSPNGTMVMGSYFQDAISDSGFDNNGNIFINGVSSNSGIGTVGSYQQNVQSSWASDSFIVKFSPNYSKEWGTYYGGDYQESESILHIDKQNSIIYIGGRTSSTNNIASSNAYQPLLDGNWSDDIYLAKFKECLSSPQTLAQNPCIGGNLNLTASGGTNYSWTGPNGFTSTQQNPVITNANTTHSGLYTCTITGTGGCDGPATVNVVVGDTTTPVPNITNLPTINGDCTTAITTIPTATDNCAGNITATTTNPLNYSVPGTYTIVWNYNDGNGNTATQNQTVVISATALPTLNTTQIFCIQENATINDITITGQNIKWYDAPTGGNLLADSTPLQNGITYYASQTINGCESTRVPVTVNIQNTPAPTGNANQSFCTSQNATLNDIAVSGSNLIWYDSATGATVLPSTTLLSNNLTYYATQTVNGCESTVRLAVTVTLINTLNANNYSEILCDDLNNDSETVNLSDYNSDLIATTNGNIFTYYHSQNGAENQIGSDAITNFTSYNLSVGNNLIFVRIDSNNGCHQIVELDLTLVSKPIIPITDIMPICEGSSITVNAGNGFDSYLWSTTETTPSITISNPGNYSVTVTENHGALTCTSVKNFTVVNSNAATISEIITSDWTYNQNTLTVLLTGNSVGDYVYSLDGIHYQTSNTFIGLESGEYIVYVKDKNGCGVKSEDFYLLMYPKFFTPNGDGYNDYWKIKLSEKEPNMTLRIFDRYGKLMKELGSDSQGWDGTYSGKVLPSNDYWFVVTRENGKEYRGHFSLKR